MKKLTKTLTFSSLLYLSVSSAFAISEAKLGSEQNYSSSFESQIASGDLGDQLGENIAVSGNLAILSSHKDDDVDTDAGSVFIYEKSGSTWSQVSQLTANDGAASDQFGNSVDIDGDYAVVGATLDDDAGNKSGSAYVFFFNGVTWNQQAKLTASDAATSDQFGHSVGISGDYVIVGAIGNDDDGDVSGSAYIFKRSGTSWNQEAKLTASDAEGGDEFGKDVAIDGDYAVVGAWREDENGANAGAAYTFHRSGVTWSEQTKLTASDGTNSDNFGKVVDINGDYVVIGAPLNDDAGSSSGSAYVFSRRDSDWVGEVKLTASDAAAGDSFGRYFSIFGKNLIIGANGVDDNGNNSGAAYIFRRSGSNWNENEKITGSGADEHFGISVAIEDDYFVIGSRIDSNNNGAGTSYSFSYSGGILEDNDNFGSSVDIDNDFAIVGANNANSVTIFQRINGGWSLHTDFSPSDEHYGDDFGTSVAIDGDYAIIGASDDDDDGTRSGSAYILFFNGVTWNQQAKLTASDATASDQFGHSVSISGDYVIVGAIGNDEVGSASGSAYIFKRSGTSWNQEAKLTASDAEVDDEFGKDVAIDGDYAVVGAWREDENGSNAGAAYTFLRSGVNWNEQTKLIANDGASGDNFGSSVSISQDYVIVGSRLDDDAGSSSGSAYIFHRNVADWSQHSKLTANDASANTGFGASVSIFGNKAIIGAGNKDDIGTDSGASYVFERTGAIWNQTNKFSASDVASGDNFGTSVATDGVYIINGSTSHDGFGTDAGAAYIYLTDGGDFPLFVEIESFEARQIENTIQLSWATASETENEGFNVYRKTGESNFVQIASFRTHEELLGQGNTTGQTNYIFVDDSELKVNETYTYYISDVEFNGLETKHEDLEQSVVFGVDSEVVRKFELAQNFPNPFNPSTTLKFQVAKDSRVSLKIYNILGKEVKTLVNEVKVAGNYDVKWDGLNNKNEPVSTGVYFAKIQAGSFSKIVKMSLIK